MLNAFLEKMQSALRALRGETKLTAENLAPAVREIRLALLEADVPLSVVKTFLSEVEEKAWNTAVPAGVSPREVFLKIVHEALTRMLSPADAAPARLHFASAPPTVVLLVGLQGSGKTTTAAKLAFFFRRQGWKTGLGALDLSRPAAVDQLKILAEKAGLPVLLPNPAETPPRAAKRFVQEALHHDIHLLFLDTAGRQPTQAEAMEELKAIREQSGAQNILLVLDAMTGRTALETAQIFHETLTLTGAVLTKADGDARGGALLALRAATGVPVLFLGSGEKTDALEPFEPSAFSSRLLGLGDIAALSRKVQELAQAAEEKEESRTFDLEFFLKQLRLIKKIGAASTLLDFLPGDFQTKRKIQENLPEAEKRLRRFEAIILSMTPKERRHPKILNGSRRHRIARGSGTSPREVNELLTHYETLKKAMKKGPAFLKNTNGFPKSRFFPF